MSEQREMTLDEWVNRLPEFHLANKQYQQLQQRIEELEQTLRDLGYCTDCSSVQEHYIDEPFSSCNCGTTEDYATRPLQKAQFVQQRNNELAAMVERLRDVVLEEVLEWVDGNDELLVRRIWDSLRLKMLEISPQQSLAEHDAEVARNAILAAAEDYRKEYMGQGAERLLTEFADIYAKRIKEGK